MAPTSTPRVGWQTSSSGGLLRERPGENELLRVAAGQPPGRALDRGGADVEGLDQPPRMARDRVPVEHAGTAEGRPVERAPARDCRRRRSRAAAHGRSGRRRHSRARRRGAGAAVATVTSRPPSSTRPGPHRAQAGDHLLELALAVAVDAGDARRSRRHGRRGRCRAGPARPRSSAASTPSQRQPRLAPPADAGRDDGSRARARPSAARARRASVEPAGTIATSRPSRSTAIRSATRSTSLELVADEDDRAALGRERRAGRPAARPTSCGVSTAVGSSRIRISAPR